MRFSKFGAKFTKESGILRLMDDLGEALAAGEKMLMLGGGNPARIPEVESKFREHMRRLIDGGTSDSRPAGFSSCPATTSSRV